MPLELRSPKKEVNRLAETRPIDQNVTPSSTQNTKLATTLLSVLRANPIVITSDRSLESHKGPTTCEVSPWVMPTAVGANRPLWPSRCGHRVIGGAHSREWLPSRPAAMRTPTGTADRAASLGNRIVSEIFRWR